MYSLKKNHSDMTPLGHTYGGDKLIFLLPFVPPPYRSILGGSLPPLGVSPPLCRKHAQSKKTLQYLLQLHFMLKILYLQSYKEATAAAAVAAAPRRSRRAAAAGHAPVGPLHTVTSTHASAVQPSPV